MKPSERIKEIETNGLDTNHPDDWNEVTWLIARVKRLEEALEFYANGWIQQASHLDKKGLIHTRYTNLVIKNDAGEVARKALEGDE